jgi:alpha-tubulin suppressor-like RCC1 family protein
MQVEGKMKNFSKPGSRFLSLRPALTVLLFVLSVSFTSAVAYGQSLPTGPDAWSSSAINADGTLFVWGFDQYNHTVVWNKIAQDSTPVIVAFPNGTAVTAWTSVANAPGFTLALGNDGNVYAWGSNGKGQLGNGTTADTNMPVRVQLPTGITATAIAVGDSTGYALASDGNIYAWGLNDVGELGVGTTSTSANPTPAAVTLPAGVTSWKKLGASRYSALAIGNNDSLYAWGVNGSGQLGIKNKVNQYSPVGVHVPPGVVAAIPIGGQATMGFVDTSGNFYGMGFNTQGMLGNGTTSAPDTPVVVIKPSGVSRWKAAIYGSKFAMGIGDNDSLYAWGQGGTGQLGNGVSSVGTNTLPLKVGLPSGSTAILIAAGNTHAFAVDQNDSVYAWGGNAEGESGLNFVNSTKQVWPVSTVGVGGVGRLYLGTASRPVVPTPLSPAGNATNVLVPPTLQWDSVANATGYWYQLSTDQTFATNVIANLFTTDTTVTIPGLSNSTTYYWRVRASNNGAMSAFIATRSFTTVSVPPGATTIISPVNNSVDQPTTVILQCSTAQNAAQYHWQVSANLTFSSFVVNDSTSDTTRTVSGLAAGIKYYWQVRAVNPGGVSSFAGPDSFTVVTVPTGTTVLTTPANGITHQRADSLLFAWSSVSKASGYWLQVSDTISFAHTAVNDSTVDTSTVLTYLNNLQKYYWRVSAFNTAGPGPFSSPDSFTTIISVPASPTLVSPTLNASNVSRFTVFEWNIAARAERYRIQVATSSQVYRSGDTAGYFLSQNVVFDTTFGSADDTTLTLSTPLDSVKSYFWQVVAFDTAGKGPFTVSKFTTRSSLLSVNEVDALPREFALLQNYPNPFNPSTTIKYNLPTAQFVTLKIYNILGQAISTLVDKQQNAGYYSLSFNAGQLGSGVYFYVLKTEQFRSVQKMLLLK